MNFSWIKLGTLKPVQYSQLLQKKKELMAGLIIRHLKLNLIKHDWNKFDYSNGLKFNYRN